MQNYEQAAQKWDIIKVQHVKMDDDEENEREEALAEVVDPNYMFGKADADAEGEVETEDAVLYMVLHGVAFRPLYAARRSRGYFAST